MLNRIHHSEASIVFVVLACLLVPLSAWGQARPTAFVGARVITITGPEIERGVVVVYEGKIVAVGPEGATAVPGDATRIEAGGKVIMPGLVDTHSHIGGVGGADGSATIQAGVRVLDSVNPFDSGFRRAVAGGLTALNIMPGSGHLLSGQTIYVKPRGRRDAEGKLTGARTIEDLMIKDDRGVAMGGIKMANGTNPMRAPPFAGTRGKAAAMVREQFIRAQEYRKKAADAAGDPKKTPARDLALEALVGVLDRKTIVHHHTHRADDIATVLRLQREFGFRVVLHHVSEAWKVPAEIFENQKAGGVIGCSVILVDSPGGKLEAANLTFDTAPMLERAGVQFSYHTDDWITDSRLFFRMAALGVRAGLSREGALRALTLSGAEQLDLQERIGSLEAGKDADLIVLSGDPFSVYTKVEQTWVEGHKVFDRSIPEDRLHAVGGFGAGRDQEPYYCCYGQ
jgi:imidazolonepropionase-like amidohydrolase